MKKRDLGTELCLAVVQAEPEKVEALLAEGADVNSFGDRKNLLVAEQTPLWAATRVAAAQISDELREFRDALSEAFPGLPHKASTEKRQRLITIIHNLISAGADLEKHCYGSTPLSQAVGGADLEVVSLLLSTGADSNAQNFSILSKLTKKEGRKRVPGYWGTVLHEAVAKASLPIVEALLAAGANATSKDHEGKTPLSFARERGYDEIAKRLEKAIAGK